MAASTVTLTIDLAADGRQVGDVQVKHSDNSVPLGVHPVPILSLRNGPGPVVVLIAGTHGDEFEGPSALMRVMRDVALADLTGQIICLPALNAPAVQASSRVTPVDGGNLNRAFPGDAAGGFTAQIAHFVQHRILPLADAAIDLHSGGKASFFAPCTLATQTADEALYARNLALAEAFGLPLIWVLGGLNDARALNGAAERAGVPMIATELGGGGGVDPAITDAAEAGIYRMLRHVGVLAGEDAPLPPARKVKLTSSEDTLLAPADGIFDRAVHAGTSVEAGQLAGWMHYVAEPRRASEPVHVPRAGFVLAHTNRGAVKRGDLLLLVAQDV